MRRVMLTLVAVGFLGPATAAAVTSTESVPSNLSGNGHNISFDGRFVMVRKDAGWVAKLLRPEALAYREEDGFPDAKGEMWSSEILVVDENDATFVGNENALAFCEPDAARAPFACDEEGNSSEDGPYDCYDLYIINSDSSTPMQRRPMMVWVANPKTADATIAKFELDSEAEPFHIGDTSDSVRGIEPTMTADGKLLVFHGHPDNDGQIGVLMYSVNQEPCAVSGWSEPKPLSSMATDEETGVQRYPLAHKALRAADGTLFEAGDLVHGAYPWLTPNGDAVVFMAAKYECISSNNPLGCGTRRNSFAVVGYPTNWGVAIVDGGVNPSAIEGARLFFSSPGPTTFSQLPVTEGLDVWPFFGSNTQNYVELIFDDGLDGNYAGFWHFNENVDKDGNLDLYKVPDVSGYFNTGVLHGEFSVATTNDGVVGRALTFDGVDDYVEIPHSITLNPTNGITLDFYIQPAETPDCDENNNYRIVLNKGGIGQGTYSVIMEESLKLQVRFRVNEEQRSLFTSQLPLGDWSHVSCEYDGSSGEAGCWVNDVRVDTDNFGQGTLTASTAPLTFGAREPSDECPTGGGAFKGKLDEVAISRIARRLSAPVVDAGSTLSDGGLSLADAGYGGSPVVEADAGSTPSDGDASLADAGHGGGGGAVVRSDSGCQTSGGMGGFAAMPFIVLAMARRGARGRALRR